MTSKPGFRLNPTSARDDWALPSKAYLVSFICLDFADTSEKEGGERKKKKAGHPIFHPRKAEETPKTCRACVCIYICACTYAFITRTQTHMTHIYNSCLSIL